MKSKGLISTALFFLTGAFLYPAQAEIRYIVTDLGTLGGTYSVAYGLNDSGQVVGCADISGLQHGFIWQDGVIKDLGRIKGGETYAASINNNGVIIGTTYPYADNAYGIMLENGEITEFGPTTSASAINNHKQVVGCISSEIYPYPDHAILWQDGQTLDLGTLGGESCAFGINDAGQIVGASVLDTPDYQVHAFLWDKGTMLDLGTLGGTISQALGINEHGWVVGGANTSTGLRHAFLWNEGEMVDLYPANPRNMEAKGLNNLNQIVGTAYSKDFDYAWLWENGNLEDLNSLINPDNGWILSGAIGINDMGQIIGTGNYNGHETAFLLTPIPEPGSLGLLGILAIFVAKKVGKMSVIRFS